MSIGEYYGTPLIEDEVEVLIPHGSPSSFQIPTLNPRFYELLRLRKKQWYRWGFMQDAIGVEQQQVRDGLVVQ
jgi:hypothetical protein